MEPPSAEWFRPKASERNADEKRLQPPKRARAERAERASRTDQEAQEAPSEAWFRPKERARRAEAAGQTIRPSREASDRRLIVALLVFGALVIGGMVLYALAGTT